MKRIRFGLAVAVLLSSPLHAGFIQQGGKLVGAGVLVPNAYQGVSVGVSADGNTAVVGGYGDSSNVGAAWVFTRSSGVWTQQGGKLIGAGAVGAASQGFSVAVSGDGNTAMIGGFDDNLGDGAAWVFTRSGGVWTQQGDKLVGTGAVGSANQGAAVALSADGNTAIVGGSWDNGNAGAAWVFTRSGGLWVQQGDKLVGSGASGSAWQGTSVALSADGDTAMIGGYDDNGGDGAAWVFTRSGGLWTQQGSKLVGTGAVGSANQGAAVALSTDSNTAIVGGSNDNGGAGAVWVFTRSGGVWTQQGSKVVGSGASGNPYQGSSVALSADGNIAMVGGYDENGGEGAAWVFTRSGGVWVQLGSKLVGSGAVGAAWQGGSIALSGDGATAIVGGSADSSFTGASWIFISSTASQLAFVQQPTGTMAGQTISPAVTVQLQDSIGDPVFQPGVSLTMSLSSGTGTLGGTLSQLTNASGLATFNDLSINLIGSKQLTAAIGGLASAVSNTFTITTPTASLSVTKTGVGSGTVTSLPPGIDCGVTCSASFALNASVTLTATPATGSTFAGWSGEGCSGTGTCPVTMNQARNVTATFNVSTGSSLSVNYSVLSFGGTTDEVYRTSAQQVTVNIVGGTATWAVSAGASFIQVSPASGSGTGTFSVSMAAGTVSSQSGTITVTGTGVTNPPQTVQVNFRAYPSGGTVCRSGTSRRR